MTNPLRLDKGTGLLFSPELFIVFCVSIGTAGELTQPDVATIINMEKLKDKSFIIKRPLMFIVLVKLSHSKVKFLNSKAPNCSLLKI
jgi:hypothetical protein